MKCERFREAASARIDGEPAGASATALADHCAACPACARWVDSAERLTRQVRVAAADVPDLMASILAGAVLPVRRVLRRRVALRVLLLLAGAVQLVLAAPSVFGDSIAMSMSAHGAHESAAWNVAIGIALVAAAASPRRAAGLVPILVGFVAILAALSIRDVAAGQVHADRLATHLAVVAGLVLVLALDRTERALPPEYGAVAPEADNEHGGLRGVA